MGKKRRILPPVVLAACIFTGFIGSVAGYNVGKQNTEVIKELNNQGSIEKKEIILNAEKRMIAEHLSRVYNMQIDGKNLKFTYHDGEKEKFNIIASDNPNCRVIATTGMGVGQSGFNYTRSSDYYITVAVKDSTGYATLMSTNFFIDEEGNCVEVIDPTKNQSDGYGLFKGIQEFGNLIFDAAQDKCSWREQWSVRKYLNELQNNNAIDIINTLREDKKQNQNPDIIQPVYPETGEGYEIGD